MTNPSRDRVALRVLAAVCATVALCEVGGVTLGAGLGPVLVRLATGDDVHPLAGALESGATSSLVWLAFGEA
jgi:hypothetical protein